MKHSIPPVAALVLGLIVSNTHAAELRGRVVDDRTGQPLPARIYIQSESGSWYFPQSASPEGSAVQYKRQNKPGSLEMHTTLSAHPFTVDLPPGKYNLTVERGKEYLTTTQSVEIADQPQEVTLRLTRWVNMAGRGWYSGDTHNHKPLADVPNVMLAEDLNVALPITYWVTDSLHTPEKHNKNPEAVPPAGLIRVSPNHVIWPLNTEYEIFSVQGKTHTLGAVLIMNHRQVFTPATPPVGPVIEEARRQGALVDLDKHNWPWSMMLVPVAGVDLFELSNNHVWRTQFGFTEWYAEYVPDYMKIQREGKGYSEWGWLDFGFQNYYALLNCGFRLKPTAGTAAGVHPVPLGWGRVYVKLQGGFDYDRWMQGLAAGHSFVTTGPMLDVKVKGAAGRARVRGRADSAEPLDRIEVVVNGRVVRQLKPANRKTREGGYVSTIETEVLYEGSSWVAVRCFEAREDQRVRFAHTAPVHLDVEGRPLVPRKDEAQYLVERVRAEIERHRGVLTPEALGEFEEALRVYESKLAEAR